MDLIDLFFSYGPWAWVVGGMVLLALELVVPGGVLVWLGVAAVLTGLLSLIIPMEWPVQLLVYGILALVSVFLGLRYFRRGEPATDQPFLNRRAQRFVGRVLVLAEGIQGGIGRVSIDDTTWRVSGPDMPAGARVRVVGATGALLKVEASV
jgi:membrane protein implicated in regulation of membrane protease activity